MCPKSTCSWWWRFESVWFHSSTLLSTLFSSQWRIHSCPVVNEFLLAVPLRSYCYAYLRLTCPGPIRPHGPRSLLLMRAHLSQHAIALAISFFFCLRIIKNTFCNENILSMNILFFVVVDCMSNPRNFRFAVAAFGLPGSGRGTNNFSSLHPLCPVLLKYTGSPFGGLLGICSPIPRVFLCFLLLCFFLVLYQNWFWWID